MIERMTIAQAIINNNAEIVKELKPLNSTWRLLVKYRDFYFELRDYFNEIEIILDVNKGGGFFGYCTLESNDSIIKEMNNLIRLLEDNNGVQNININSYQ